MALSGKRIFIKQTAHKRYDVFEVPASAPLMTTAQANELVDRAAAAQPMDYVKAAA